MSPIETPGPMPVPTRIPDDVLPRLNAALYLAQLRQAEVREFEARLELAGLAARKAAAAYASIRDSVSASIGASLGRTHGWDAETGEVREIPR